jgi:hypothetical protein
MTDRKIKAASSFMRFTKLDESPVYANFEVAVGKTDWEVLNHPNITTREWLLGELLKFLLSGKTELDFDIFSNLSEDDRTAFIWALAFKYEVSVSTDQE